MQFRGGLRAAPDRHGGVDKRDAACGLRSCGFTMMAEEKSAGQETVAVPQGLPHSPLGSAYNSARYSGRACPVGCRDDCSAGGRGNVQEHPSNGLPNGVRVEQGGARGAVRPRALPGSLRKSGGMRDKPWTCREMHELDASVAASSRG